MAQDPDDRDEVQLLRRQLSEQDATIVSLLAEVDSLAELLEREQEASARWRRQAEEMVAALEKSTAALDSSTAALDSSTAALAEQSRVSKQLVARAKQTREECDELLREVIRLRAERN